MLSNDAPGSVLTPAQEQVLAFIQLRCRETGIPPSYREIQEFFGYKAVGTVQDHVKALVKKGALEDPKLLRASRKARNIVPVGHRVEGIRRIPVYGEIAAGSTRDAAQIELGTLAIAEGMAVEPCFGLRVVGDSMVDVGIFEGDFLIVERGARVRSGDIVVALLDGETTVKRYVEKKGGVFLVPENRRLAPIPVAGRNLQIQGKVVGLQRKL